MQLVLVTWEDACEVDNSPWAFPEDTEYGCKTVVQVGWMLDNTEEFIVLTHAHTEGQVARRNLIPHSAIKSMVVLVDE
jgi:hypothetical protein